MAKKPRPPWETKATVQPSELETEVTQITALPTELAEELEGGDDDRLFRHTPSFFERYKIWVVAAGALVLVVLGLVFWPRSRPVRDAAISSAEVLPTPTSQPTAIPSVRALQTPAVVVPSAQPEPAVVATKSPPVPAPTKSKVPVKRSPVKVQPRVAAAPAKLFIEAQPWAIVYINNKRLNRITPIRGLELSEGRYRLRLENPQTKKRIEKDLRLKAGQTLSLKFQMR